MMRVLLALWIALASSPDSRADEIDRDERDAKAYYDRGQKLFNLQKFAAALEQFQRAYDSKPIPEFLFNIGQCHRNLEEYDAAIFSFQKFLKLAPDAPNREQVETLIGELERKRDQAAAAKLTVRPTPLPPPRPRPTPIYKKWWFWSGLAAASVGAGVGVYFVTAPAGPPPTTFGNIDFGR